MPRSTPQYEPRDPSDSVLGNLARDYLPALREALAVEEGDEMEEADETAPPGGRLPEFVLRELRALAACGDFTRGFIRLQCSGCRTGRVVPFSCKGRLCTSCGARRMADTAAHLVDRVLRPDVGWRQWVITFPAELAVGLCFQAELAAAVTRLCARILSGFQSRRSNPDAPGRPRPAAIAFIQRFSDGLGPWFHIHFLLPDGVFRELPDSLDVPFEHHRPPTPREVESVLADIARRAGALVVRRGGRLSADNPVLLRCGQQRATPIRKPTRPPVRPRPPNPLRAEQDRFTLHAATAVAPHQPKALQRLCRYLTRPVIAEERLQRLPDGRVAVKLKRPRRGVERFIFQPVALLARLCALVPPPYFNLVRYFGPLSSASPLRRYAVPSPPEPTPQRPTAPERPRRMTRADLLARVFGFNVLACPCGGHFRPIAVITQPDVIQAILAAMVLSNSTSARAPPQHSIRAN
mgnify:CR=1 FL=1